MNIKTTLIKPKGPFGSGRVRRYSLEDGTRISQISTFCPEIMGPGPTHLYLIERDAVILVDTGIPTNFVKTLFYLWRREKPPSGQAHLPDDLSINELTDGMKAIKRPMGEIDALVITHGHLDHFLNGQAILQRSSPQVFAHILDLPVITSPWGILRQWMQRRQFFKSFGMPEQDGDKLESIFDGDEQNNIDLSIRVDRPIIKDTPFILKNSALNGIEIRHIPGHSEGSIGLIVGTGREKVLLCGDVLLYPITPNPDDLLIYLRTLNDLKKLENIQLVLPGHGKIFHDLGSRIEFIEKHHQKRLKKTYRACNTPCSIWDIATTSGYFDIFVDPKQFNPLAAFEALAHLELLKMAEGVSRIEIKNGVHYYRNSGERFEDVYNRVLGLVRDKSINTILKY